MTSTKDREEFLLAQRAEIDAELAALRTPDYNEEMVRRIVLRAQQEIIRDIQAGMVPNGIEDFSVLHDHVDANEYGGLTTTYDDAPLETVNEVQDRLHQWMVRGGATVPSLTKAMLLKALEAYPDTTYLIAWGGEYLNISSVDTEEADRGDEAAVVLNLSDTFDSRQW